MNYVSGYFYKNSLVLEDGPKWYMSLRSAGTMRFRWNETNENRLNFLHQFADDTSITQPELIHSHIVYDVSKASDILNKTGDGVITVNKNLMPVVTAADCMPIFIYDPVTKVFGALHSGWKGTGIVKDAILLAKKNYKAKIEDFCVVMGPHIHNCCYIVDEERAKYFSVNFTPDCVTPLHSQTVTYINGHSKSSIKGENKYRLSLAKANLNILLEMGVPENNIVVCSDCTCCNPTFGSFRRETVGIDENIPPEKKSRMFTVQSCFIRW